MARFSVAWNDSNNTLTIKKAGARSTKANDIVGDVYLNVVGEVPDASPHPETSAHLRNLALKQGVEDFRAVTVVNATDHPGFDRFEQEPDEAYMTKREAFEADRVKVGFSPINHEDMTAGEELEEDSRPPEEKSHSAMIADQTKDGGLEGPST